MTLLGETREQIYFLCHLCLRFLLLAPVTVVKIRVSKSVLTVDGKR